MSNDYWQRKAAKMIRDAHPDLEILSAPAGQELTMRIKGKSGLVLGANDDWLGKFNTYLAGQS